MSADPPPIDEPADPARQAPGARRANVAAVESCYQLVLWLIPVLDKLPRKQKFQLGDRLQSIPLCTASAVSCLTFH